MKNLITTSAALALIVSAGAAAAAGGHVNQFDFIKADTPRAQFAAENTHENANARTGTKEVTERGVTREVPVTIFATDSAVETGATKGR